MTTTRNFFEIEVLQRKAEIHGFEVGATSNGLFYLRANPNIWDLYHDKATWHFESAEECNAFLEGFSTRGLYEQVKKGGTKSAPNKRRTRSNGNTKRRKPGADRKPAKAR